VIKNTLGLVKMWEGQGSFVPQKGGMTSFWDVEGGQKVFHSRLSRKFLRASPHIYYTIIDSFLLKKVAVF